MTKQQLVKAIVRAVEEAADDAKQAVDRVVDYQLTDAMRAFLVKAATQSEERGDDSLETDILMQLSDDAAVIWPIFFEKAIE